MLVLAEVRVSVHGYDELAANGIRVREVLNGVSEGIIVEDYPGYPKDSCVLILQRVSNEEPIHVVWGIPRNADSPAVLVTAYRPDPRRWSRDFLKRKK